MIKFLDRYVLWSIWVMLAVVSVVVFPQGTRGILGAIAAVAPLVFLVKPRLHRRQLILAGLLVISVVALLSGGAGGISAVLISVVVLSVGVGLAPGVSERRNLVSDKVVKHVENKEACTAVLAVEVGRARRHGRPLHVVALRYQDGSEHTTNEQQLAHLKRIVQQEIHVYCPVYQFQTHVVVVMPELQEEDLQALIDRLHGVIDMQNLSAVNVGIAGFPKDAVTSVGLLEKALENCTSAPNSRDGIHPLTVVGGTGFNAEIPSP